MRGGTLDLIGVDYLQLMRAEHPTGNRAEDVSGFSRPLKQLAQELDWPVFVVSKLDRGLGQRPGRNDRPDGQPPPLTTDRGDRLCRRASVDRLDRCRSVTASHVSTTRAKTGRSVIIDVSRISVCKGAGEEGIFFCRGPQEM